MLELLAANPLLVLFLVAALGYPLGRLGIGGFRLGVAAVLFVGLAAGALDPRLALPDVVMLLGLVLFVYTVGLASGPHFAELLRRGGVRTNLLVALALAGAAALAAGLALPLRLEPAAVAGLFAGGLTNTPALAAVLEALRAGGAGDAAESLPVVAYAVAYPVGVLGPIAALALLRRIEARRGANGADGAVAAPGGVDEAHPDLVNRAVRVSRPDAAAMSIEGWRRRERWHALAVRILRDGHERVASPHDALLPGDVVSFVGDAEELRRIAAVLGAIVPDHPEFDRSHLDFRRVFVSNPEVAGRTLEDLDLHARFGALVTRVRRGDVDLLAEPGTRLELGDRVRVVAPRERMGELARLFGDSYRALSEVDVVSLGLGIALGMLIGLIPVPLPGGATFRLGLAGGPLVAALALGAAGRTGPVLWQLPYNANLTLRQLGLVLFLAGVGTRSGWDFARIALAPEGLALLLAGAVLTLCASVATLLAGRLWLQLPVPFLMGVLAGQQTQPAVLAYAAEQAGDDAPALGYATVFPLATLLKLLLAQLLLALA